MLILLAGWLVFSVLALAGGGPTVVGWIAGRYGRSFRSVSLAPVLGLSRLGLSASAGRVAARATLAQRIAGTIQIAIAMTFSGAAIAFIWFLGVLLFGREKVPRGLHLFAACMDEEAAETKGCTPIADDLARVSAVASKGDLPEVVAALHRHRIATLFRFGSDRDFEDASRMIAEMYARTHNRGR